MLDDLLKPEQIKTPEKKDKRLYAVIPFRAVHDKRLTTRLKDALLIICSYAGKDGQLWPGVERLAEDMGITIATMHQHVRKLTQYGYLMTINERFKPGERAKKRAIVYDPDNPPNADDWKIKENDYQLQLEQQLNTVKPELTVSEKLSDELALYKVWKRVINQRFTGSPTSVDQIPKELTRYSIEDFENALVVALKPLNTPPSTARVALRYLK